VAAPGYSRHMTVMAASVGGAILIVLVLIVVFVGTAFALTRRGSGQKVSAPELFFDLVFVSALTQVTARKRAAS
jgi:hypothetical protein